MRIFIVIYLLITLGLLLFTAGIDNIFSEMQVVFDRYSHISIELITRVVCEFYNLEENKLREKNRRKEIVLARQVAMYLSKLLTKSSLKTIGLHFGGRDHSTVIHSQTSIENLVNDDPKMKETIDSLKNKIEMRVT